MRHGVHRSRLPREKTQLAAGLSELKAVMLSEMLSELITPIQARLERLEVAMESRGNGLQARRCTVPRLAFSFKPWR